MLNNNKSNNLVNSMYIRKMKIMSALIVKPNLLNYTLVSLERDFTSLKTQVKQIVLILPS